MGSGVFCCCFFFALFQIHQLQNVCGVGTYNCIQKNKSPDVHVHGLGMKLSCSLGSRPPRPAFLSLAVQKVGEGLDRFIT